jgi:hypothetical protein
MRTALCGITRRRYSHVWPIDPKSGAAPRGWNGWPDGKKFALVLTHDVDTAKGQENVRQLAQVEIELGFRSAFNFVPERYAVSAELRRWLKEKGFEVGVHDLSHDGLLFSSYQEFLERSTKINRYLREWQAKGFRAGAMHHNLDWIGGLEVEFDCSTFDTDPFEPQPEGVGTIFPFCVPRSQGKPYAELPYTLAQDFTVFVLFRERTIRLWTTKLDWIVQQGGMALLNVHPDYIQFTGGSKELTTYPIERYREFLRYCLEKYRGQYWNALPSEVAEYTLRGAPPLSAANAPSGPMVDKAH